MADIATGASAPAAAPASQGVPSTEGQIAATESSSSEEGDSEAADEAAALEAKAAEKPLTKVEKKKLKSLKIKVDGKEFDEELPFEIDEDQAEYMKKHLQMSKVSQKRMAESAKQTKDIEDFIHLLKTNPRAVLADPNIGVDLKQFATQIIEEEIENSRKSPEQLKAEKYEAELKQLREEREAERTAAQKREFDALQKQEFERYDVLMTQALEKSDLPKSPYVVKKMADLMLLGLNNGVDVSPQDVLPMVREEIMSDIKEMFAAMPEDVIESFIGSDKLNSLRKKRVAAAKAATQTTTASQIKDTGKKAPAAPAKEETKQSVADWLKSM